MNLSFFEMFAKFKSKLVLNLFFRNFVILSSGTLLSQLVPILMSPILTRLYSPSDFAMLAIFTAFVGTFTPIICGKYEVALILPKREVYAKHLLGISLYFALGLSFVLFVVFFIWGNSLLVFVGAERLGSWVYSVPVALFLTGIFVSANYLANRQGKYKQISLAKLTNSIFTAIIGILAAVLGAGFGGLLIGMFCGLTAASLLLFKQNFIFLRHQTFKWNKAKRMLMVRYWHYPVYNGISGFLNGFILSMPVFFLSHYFSETVVGYYAVVMRVSLAPVAFVSDAVSQINLKKIVDLVNLGISPIQYLIKLIVMLLCIISLPTFIMIVWGPDIFSFVFGPEWMEAGRYARILMPAIAIQFIASTLSSTRGATNNNQYTALYRIVDFLLMGGVLMYFSSKSDIYELLYAISISMVFSSFLNFYFIFLAAKRPRI